MDIKILSTTLGLSAVLSFSASAANLLANPSFENGSGSVTFSPSTEFGGANAYDLTSPSSEIPGWVWEQTPGTPGGAAWLNDPGNLFDTDGDHLLFLDPHQCIQWHDTAALGAGEEFVLDFNIAAWTRGQDISLTDTIESGDASLIVEYNYTDTNGITVFDTYTLPSEITAPANQSKSPGDLDWLSDSFFFTVPTDYASDYQLVLTATGGLLLDNLSVSPVPEPSTGGLFALTMVTLLMRRKRQG